jgi:hypothetical protein
VNASSNSISPQFNKNHQQQLRRRRDLRLRLQRLLSLRLRRPRLKSLQL